MFISFICRISVIFRVRSAKAVKITDLDLIKRLGIIVSIFAVFLSIRTIVGPPTVIVAKTADDLKAFICQTDWWDHVFTASKLISLCLPRAQFVQRNLYNSLALPFRVDFLLRDDREHAPMRGRGSLNNQSGAEPLNALPLYTPPPSLAYGNENESSVGRIFVQ